MPAETPSGAVALTPAGGWPSRGELLRPLPATTDVLVVGGGLAGASLAYYLARLGVEVVLVERGELNREASGTNAGSFHFQIAIHQLTGTDTANVRDRLEARFGGDATIVSGPVPGGYSTQLRMPILRQADIA